MGQRIDAEVVVVGGGPAGAATAWALAREGADVLVIDRARFPRDKICAEYLSPQASRILSDMGVLDEIERTNPAHLAGMRVRAPNGFVANGEFGLRVTDVTREASLRIRGVNAIGPDGAPVSISARYVVGADGLRSVIARRLGLVKTSRIWPRRIALVAHYRKVQGVTDMGEMHVEYDGYFGIVEVGDGLMNVAVVVPQSRAREIGEDKTAFFEQWIAARPHLAERFQGAERITEVRATGPFATASHRAWSPGAALVGDAADFFDPFTGEGIYAALRGGELLAPYLLEALERSAEDEARVLAGYDRGRKREFGGKWKLERIVGMAIAYPYFLNNAAKVLSRRKDMADLLVGVAGDFIPPRVVLRPRFLYSLFIAPAFTN